MDSERKIIKRIEDLRKAIAYARDTQRLLSTGQRICCQQEIAQWYRVLDGQSYAKYIIPDHLEDLVQECLTQIEKHQWTPPEIIY